MAAGETVTGPGGEQIVLGEIGHRVVFENELVRVWEVLLEPGEEQPWHRHHHPYLIVPLEAAQNTVTTLAEGSSFDVDEEVGEIVFRDWGDVHMLRNRGNSRYRSRLVELKQPS